MSDDLLARATRALREQTRDEDDAARFTRARVLSSVRGQRVQRRTRVAFLIPIAACFVAASAWGAATGKLSHVVQQVESVLGMRAASPPPLEPKRAAQGPRHDAPAPLPAPPAPEPALTAPSEPEPASATISTPAAPAPIAGAATAQAAPSSSAADRDPAYELYREAHHAHFVAHDSAAALRAWDAYLAAAPNGQFALEARYNRALCLVKLGRNAEARSALQAFADGRYGSYRRHEAEELLAALASAGERDTHDTHD